MEKLKQAIVLSIVFGLLVFWVKYIAYLFRTMTVLPTLAIFLFTYITIFGSDISFILFLLPIDKSGSLHWDQGDVMRVYSLFAFGFMLLSLLGKGLWWLSGRLSGQAFHGQGEDQTNQPEVSSQRACLNLIGGRRLLQHSIVITIIFSIWFIVMPMDQLAEGASLIGMYVVSAIFYLMAIVSSGIYVVLDTASDQMFGWAISQIRSTLNTD